MTSGQTSALALGSLGTVEVYIDRDGMLCLNGMHTNAEIPGILAQVPEVVAHAQWVRKTL